MRQKKLQSDRLNNFEDPSISATASGYTSDNALVVEKKTFAFAAPPNEFVLENGERLGPITIAYETYGTLNSAGDNAIMICHALTGDSHAAGMYATDASQAPATSRCRLGWWDPLIGPGRPFDTERYFVICSNVLGGCSGTTGPASIDPATGRPYGSHFPIFTIRDQVRVQRVLLEHLGVKRLVTVTGGSSGGMQVLEWMVTYPEMIESAIPIAVSAYLHPQAIAYNYVGRQAIMLDPHWHNGDYYEYGPAEAPDIGLAVARMVGMITYQSDASMRMKFGRDLTTGEAELLRGAGSFQVESYLHYQGESLVKRFDANSYLYLVRAMDLHDIARGYGSWQDALRRVRARVLMIGINSDILFPTHLQLEIVRFLRGIGVDASYFEINSPYGHDAFLIEYEQMASPLRGFLMYVEGARRGWEVPGWPEIIEKNQQATTLVYGQRSPGRF